MSIIKGSSSQKAFAYTPGLKTLEYTAISKERILPIVGEVLVDVGDKVNPETVVATAMVRGDPVIINAAVRMGLTPDELPQVTVKKVGDEVKVGDVLCEYRAFFGLIHKEVTSQINGTVETISDVTGRIILRGPTKPVEVRAYILGEITEIIPNSGTVIQTNGALIQGLFGLGGETNGKIRVSVDLPEKILTADAISTDDKDCILVGGSTVTADCIKKTIEVGARGIIVGGITTSVLRECLMEDIGVAITGQEDFGLTLIITEGIGKIKMSQKAFNLLKRFNGYMASINGATQIRAGVIRPEIIIPHEKTPERKSSRDGLEGGMALGTPVRIIRDPYFGNLGKVVDLPVNLQEIQTGSSVRVLRVELEDGKQVVVPRANVEILEQ